MQEFYNAGDPVQVAAQKKITKVAIDNEQDDLKKVLSTIEGRRLIWKYLSACGIWQTSFNASGSVVYFNEGRRNIGLFILNDVQSVSPDLFLQMMKEQKGNLK